MTPFSERVRSVFMALQTSAHKFANNHGLNRSSVFNMLDSERRPSFELVERMCSVEPRISAEYLLRGEGEPLRNLNEPTALSTVQQLRDFQVQINEFIEKRVQELEA